jgi:hypothetical protein
MFFFSESELQHGIGGGVVGLIAGLLVGLVKDLFQGWTEKKHKDREASRGDRKDAYEELWRLYETQKAASESKDMILSKVLAEHQQCREEVAGLRAVVEHVVQDRQELYQYLKDAGFHIPQGQPPPMPPPRDPKEVALQENQVAQAIELVRGLESKIQEKHDSLPPAGAKLTKGENPTH